MISFLFALVVSTTQWTASTDRRDSHVVLEGNWQSCQQADGEFAERVYEHVVWMGDGQHHVAWQLHLGPKDEFAVFRGGAHEHEEHGAGSNLLTAFHYNDVDMVNGVGRQWTFTVERRTYLLNVKLAGGSRGECESYWVKLERMTQ